MSADEYWYGDPYLAAAYRRADELRRRRENESLWLQGLYIYDAFSVTMANAFKKKGAKSVSYPDKPYDVARKTKKEKEAAAKAEQQKIRKHFEKMRRDWISRNGERKE